MTLDTVAIAPDAHVIQWPHASRLERGKSTDGRVVFAIGDIHGCYAQLAILLEAIVGDMASIVADKQPLLVFCGDYIDRGPLSSSVVSALVWLSRQPALDVVFLRGNHEVMLLDFLQQPDASLAWLKRDGKQTLASYGVDVSTISDEDLAANCVRLRDQMMDKLPTSHFDFLRNLRIKTICGDYVFVHAGLKPGRSISRQEDDDCLWIGEEFLTSDYRFEKIVVHGHSWSSDDPDIKPNRIGIDTGAYATGTLTAVRLEGADITFLQSRLHTVDTSRPENYVSENGQEGS